jgi:uncharacterized membrane protein
LELYLEQEVHINASWKPGKLDLLLSVGITILLPLTAGFLFARTGAFLPLLIYYGLAWGLVKWRRGAIGYRNAFPARPPLVFFLNVGVIVGCLVCAWLSPLIEATVNLPGVLVTALLWAPLNAATEQILWIYIFEAWDLFPGKHHLAFRVVGLALFAAFVGLIHTGFWVKFLDVVDSGTFLGVLFVILTSVSGFLHIVVWRKSRQMFFTFIPHLLFNLVPIIWTHYSIVPHLFR